MTKQLKNNWLKLKVDFFTSGNVKKLRKLAGGDKYLIIYLKLMLLTINNEGHYELQNLEPTIEEELALIMDEEVENVKMAFSFLRGVKFLQDIDNNTVFFNEVPKLIGKYDDSSERVAKYRLRKKQEHECNTLQSLQSHVTLPLQSVTCNESNAPRERERLIHIPSNLQKLPEKKYIEEIFEFWKQIAKELNTHFTSQEWDAIYGYIEAKPSLPHAKIRNLLLTIYKWADEDGLDIITALNTSHAYPFPKQPYQRIVHDKNNKRVYGKQLQDLRRNEIETEELKNG